MAQGFNVKKEENKRYRLDLEETSGWYLVSDNLTQKECQELYNQKLYEGIHPQRLRITRIS